MSRDDRILRGLRHDPAPVPGFTPNLDAVKRRAEQRTRRRRVSEIAAGVAAALLVATPLLLLSPLLNGQTPVGGGTGGSSRPDRIRIYAAALRQFYEHDSSFGPSPSFSIIYLYGRTTPQASFPEAGSSAGTPIPGPILRGLRASLGDLPPIEVANDIGRVTRPSGQVRHGGVVIVLGPIATRGTHVTVSVSLYAGNVGGAGATYVLAEGPSGWRVVKKSGTGSGA
jgi:hypothetical protein